MTFSALLSLAVSLCKALPALERLARLAVAEIDAAREREAAQRLANKDAAVDAAIDTPPAKPSP